ncbi:MAG: hypothetical protein MHPSP_000140 [Paramarteilia canceri]
MGSIVSYIREDPEPTKYLITPQDLSGNNVQQIEKNNFVHPKSSEKSHEPADNVIKAEKLNSEIEQEINEYTNSLVKKLNLNSKNPICKSQLMNLLDCVELNQNKVLHCYEPLQKLEECLKNNDGFS